MTAGCIHKSLHAFIQLVRVMVDIWNAGHEAGMRAGWDVSIPQGIIHKVKAF